MKFCFGQRVIIVVMFHAVICTVYVRVILVESILKKPFTRNKKVKIYNLFCIKLERPRSLPGIVIALLSLAFIIVRLMHRAVSSRRPSRLRHMHSARAFRPTPYTKDVKNYFYINTIWPELSCCFCEPEKMSWITTSLTWIRSVDNEYILPTVYLSAIHSPAGAHTENRRGRIRGWGQADIRTMIPRSYHLLNI